MATVSNNIADHIFAREPHQLALDHELSSFLNFGTQARCVRLSFPNITHLKLKATRTCGSSAAYNKNTGCNNVVHWPKIKLPSVAG